MAGTRYVSLTEVLEFVAKCEAHGVPRRIAISRAAKRFKVDSMMVRSAVRA